MSFVDYDQASAFGFPSALLLLGSSFPRPSALAASLTLHLVVASLLCASAWLIGASTPRPPAPSRCAAALLVPAPSLDPSTSQAHSIARRNPTAASPPSADPPASRILAGIQIGVLPDHSRQLLPVLRRLDGRIGLASFESPRTLRESFRARDFHPLGPGRLEEWLAFRLWDPQAWPELAPILSRCHEDCIVYALFPTAFQGAIVRAARRRLGPERGLFRILLRFDAKSPSGFVLVSVESQSANPTSKPFSLPGVLTGEGRTR